jgi:hypothetical protein
MIEITYLGVCFKEPVYPKTINHTYLGTFCSAKAQKLELQPCEICGKTEDIERHHEDYSKPLEVRWLCKSHHLDIHRIFRSMRKGKELKLFLKINLKYLSFYL